MSEINLKTPGILKQITDKIKLDVDAYCLTYNDGHRSHLGASLIGHECKRYLWYTFRWVKAETFDARMNRLFRRGHREEAQFIDMLRGSGFKVQDVDLEKGGFWYCQEIESYYNTADSQADVNLSELVVKLDWQSKDIEKHIKIAEARGFKFNQFRISDCKGHFGGSMDGKLQFPESYGINGTFLCEFKTNGTGKGFNDLCSFGVKSAKEQHFCQQSVYGYKEGLTHSVYMNVNKNDDSLHIEFVELDHNLGKQLIQKAEQIIFSPKPPAKFSLNPTHFTCKFCSKSDICHENKPAEKNCRSCIFAEPVENAEWKCHNFGAIIPKEYIANGCDNWQDITKQAE